MSMLPPLRLAVPDVHLLSIFVLWFSAIHATCLGQRCSATYHEHQEVLLGAGAALRVVVTGEGKHMFHYARDSECRA